MRNFSTLAPLSQIASAAITRATGVSEPAATATSYRSSVRMMPSGADTRERTSAQTNQKALCA